MSAWSARHIDQLIAVERHGLAAAKGTALLRFRPAAAHILLTCDQVTVVDWPHARLGVPVIDLLMVLASAAANGLDPDPLLRAQPMAGAVDDADVTGILAALTGFGPAGAFEPMPPGLDPLAAASCTGRGALGGSSAGLALPVLRHQYCITSTASPVLHHQYCTHHQYCASSPRNC